jgi:hypothetical protein
MRVITLILISSLFLTSCATIFSSKEKDLMVTSNPSDTEVYVNEKMMGKTPLELELKPDKTYVIKFKREGYQTVERVVNSKTGAGWIVMDILFGVVPVIVDAATGDWKKLDQEAVDATLEKNTAISTIRSK